MCNYVLIAKDTRKARKQHRCVWCGGFIVIGERYTHERCVFDGDPQSNAWHLECEQDMSEAMDAYGDPCFEYSPWEAERPETRLGFTSVKRDESVL